MKEDRLPNFFILGAAKCGTSSLYYYLRQHPQIYLPKDKEPHFFDSDVFWNEGLEKYLQRHFKGAQRYPARGEATPAYFHRWQKVIPRMKEIYGERSPKFILIFRDPVERAWSHYLHMRRNRLEHETFERALELEEERLKQSPNKRLKQSPNKWFGYFSDGLYASQLEHWLEAFPKDHFLFLLSDDLRAEPERAIKKICELLNVDSTVKIDVSIQANPASEPRWESLQRFLITPSFLKKPFKVLLPRYTRKRIVEWVRRTNLKSLKEKPRMKSETERWLRERYAEEIQRLGQMIGRDVSHWLPQ